MSRVLPILILVLLVGVIRIFWKRPTVYLMTRIPPATPEGWKPKIRVWVNGEEQYG